MFDFHVQNPNLKVSFCVFVLRDNERILIHIKFINISLNSILHGQSLNNVWSLKRLLGF